MKKLLFLLSVSAIIFSSCAKKGNIDIKDIGFWANNCTPPYEIQFYLDISYQPSEVSYNWDFGDGTTSTEKEPVHLYSEPGKYTAVLTVVNYKTTVEKSFVVNVSQNPMPIFNDFDYEVLGQNNYAPCEVKFYNNSQYATNFFWDFGDGLGSADVEPTHIFQEGGIYNVYLHAICNGDTVSSVLQLTILPPPNKIYIDVVSVWLPPDFLGGLFELQYATGNLNETPIDLDYIAANSFPITWYIGEDLFFFDGDYNSEQLYFEINDAANYGLEVYSFSIRFEQIQEEHYPDTLYWDSGSGFEAEVLISYGNE